MEITVLNANSVGPDQTPRSATSDLGLHGLPMSLLWDARLKWIKYHITCHTLFGFGLFSGIVVRQVTRET